MPVSWPVTIDGKATVKGLPSGLKYSGGAISGKATKAGTYTVAFSASNAAGSASKTITIVVENPGFEVTCSAKPNGASSPCDVAAGETIGLFVGVKQEFSLSAEPGMSDVANSAVSSMSAKGLPPGLKLSGGVISGVPTKPGSYSATIAFKNKYGWTAGFDMKFVVSAMPEWAVGTFEGGCGTAWSDGARYEFSVSSAGKLSGKVFRLGETWTMSAGSCSAFIDGEKGEFVFDVAMKSGKKTLDAKLYVSDSTYDAIGVSCLEVEGWGVEAHGARAVWTSGICADAIKRASMVGKTMTLEGSELGLANGESISLVFAKDGSIKASAKLSSGAAATTSARLVPGTVSTETSGRAKVVEAHAFLYFPPAGKNAEGRFFAVDIRLD